MKFLELELQRFGHFTGRTLNFGDASLHVIYGSNEAGKSTTLRAVSGLLFGIPATTRDHHLHSMQELRIGARLEDRGGERMHFLRRKGNKNTLLNLDESPMDEAVLNRFLGGVSRELFETMFGLSHEALVRGGRDLLEGKGEIGESLFGAGLGVRGIHAVRMALQKEAGDIFAPRAQNPPLNKAIKTFDDARKRINQLALKPREWQDLRKRLQEAGATLAEREREQGDALAELHRLQRLQRVLPALRAWEALLAQKQEMGEIKLTAETCAQERSQAQQVLNNAEVRANRLEDERTRCERERRELQVPEALLARESDIEELQKRLGAHLKAKQDLPGLEVKVAAAREEAQGILKGLVRQETLEQAETLRIDVATQKRIHRLGQEGARFETESKRAGKDVAAMEKSLRESQRQQEALPPERDVGDLERLLAEMTRREDPESKLRSLETEIAGFKEKAEKQLATLLLWRGPLEQAVALPLAPDETVERFRGRFEELANERRLIESQRDGARKQMEDAATGIALLESHGAVPSAAEWRRLKDRRDVEWQEIRGVWLGGGRVIVFRRGWPAITNCGFSRRTRWPSGYGLMRIGPRNTPL